jgi:hypothetical protein
MAKNVLWGKFFWHLLMQELCTFSKSAQNCASFDAILRNKFIQHIKNAFFLTSLRISIGTQNHSKESFLGKSLDPIVHSTANLLH